MTTPSTGVIAPTESQGPATGVAAVTAGSVSAYDALCLAVSWEKAAAERDALASESRSKGDIDEAIWLENAAAAYMRCARELTKLTGYPNGRQPTQNEKAQPRAKNGELKP